MRFLRSDNGIISIDDVVSIGILKNSTTIRFVTKNGEMTDWSYNDMLACRHALDEIWACINGEPAQKGNIEGATNEGVSKHDITMAKRIIRNLRKLEHARDFTPMFIKELQREEQWLKDFVEKGGKHVAE